MTIVKSNKRVVLVIRVLFFENPRIFTETSESLIQMSRAGMTSTLVIHYNDGHMRFIFMRSFIGWTLFYEVLYPIKLCSRLKEDLSRKSILNDQDWIEFVGDYVLLEIMGDTTRMLPDLRMNIHAYFICEWKCYEAASEGVSFGSVTVSLAMTLAVPSSWGLNESHYHWFMYFSENDMGRSVEPILTLSDRVECWL